MENNRLLRSIDTLKKDFEVIIDQLISEIEELESDKVRMQSEIDELKEKIEDWAKELGG